MRWEQMVSNESNLLHWFFEPITGVKDNALHFVQAHLRPDFAGSAPATDPDVFMQAIEQVCLYAQAWQQSAQHIQCVYISLEAPIVEHPAVVSLLERALVRTSTDPRLIGIIVHHALLQTQSIHVSQSLKKCKGLGLSIAIDEIEGDNIQPTYLRSLPIDAVRMRSASMQDIAVGYARPSMARALIDLAHDLCWQVWIKDIDDLALLPHLQRHQCEWVQGPAIAPQMTADELVRYVQAHGVGSTSEATRTLLLVDDEDNILASLRRLFRSQGYKIILAHSGAEGLAYLKDAPVDVIISDQRMPSMTGVEFLRQAKVLRPETIRIVLSGYTELQSITEAINEGAIYKFLTKPWDDDLLKAQIVEAFRYKEMMDENHRLTLQVSDMNDQLSQANTNLANLVKEQEAKMVRDQARLFAAHEVLQSIPCPMVGLDTDMMVAFVNADGEAALGITAGAILGEPATSVLPASLMEVVRAPLHTSLRISLSGRQYLASSRPLQISQGQSGRLLVLLPCLRGCMGEGGEHCG